MTDEELDRIGALATAYCESELARRVASLDGVRPEVPFAFEHDGVLLHGRLDILHRAGGRALIVDFKTNVLGDRSPEEIVSSDYTLQRLVYALACLRTGDEEVEVAYVFLERPEEVVSTTFTAADCSGARGRALGRDRSGSTRGSSSRRRASSPARAARRSTSCAQGRATGAGSPARRPSSEADRSRLAAY